jgi:hypothetical protein
MGIYNSDNRITLTYSDRIEKVNRITKKLESYNDEPAIIYNDGRLDWFKNGKRHNLSGAAIKYPSGLEEYWVDGVKKSKEEFVKIRKDLLESKPSSLNNTVNQLEKLFDSQINELNDVVKKISMKDNDEETLKGFIKKGLDVEEKLDEVKNNDDDEVKNNDDEAFSFSLPKEKTLKEIFDDLKINLSKYEIKNKDNIDYHYVDGILIRKDEYIKSRLVKTTHYNKEGKIHSPVSIIPAVTEFYTDGSCTTYHYNNGELIKDGIYRVAYNNKDIPVLIFINKNGKLSEVEKYNPKGEILSFTKYYENGNIKSLSNYNNTHCTITVFDKKGLVSSNIVINKDLQLDGENSFNKYKDGKLSFTGSFKNGISCCYNNKPSSIAYNDKFMICYYKDGFKFRTDKPSIIKYDLNSNLISETFTDEFGVPIKSKNIRQSNLKNNEVVKSNNDLNIKSDLTSAGYRVVANQISKGFKKSIISLMKNKGMEDSKLKHLVDVLDSEFGDVLISMSIGYALTYSKYNKNETIQKISDEFRIEGMSTIGNVVVDTAMEYILPSIIKETQTLKYRVEEENISKPIEYFEENNKTNNEEKMLA